MSNIRSLKYNETTGRFGITVAGKTHWVDKNKLKPTANPAMGQVKVGARNFFFPINDNLTGMTSGGMNAFWNVEDSKPSRIIPPLVFPRIRADVGYWREAIFEMENKPWNWRVKTQTILQDTIFDAHVYSCWKKRKRLTLLKKPCFYDSKGKVIEGNKDLNFIYTKWWRQYLDYTLDAQGYGYQLIELGDLKNGGFPDIGIAPRQNISPDREVVTTVVYNVNGLLFNINPDDAKTIKIGKKDIPISAKAPNGEYYFDWTIWVKTPNEFGSHTSTCGYGILYWVALYALLIRNNLQNNADFNEKFLQPIRELITTKTDKKERQEAFQNLVDAGASLVFLHDPQDELKLTSNQSIGTAHQSYGDFELRLKKGISALLLGHEDAMHSVGSKLGGGSKGASGKSGHDEPIQQAISETESEQTAWLCDEVNSNLDKFRKLGFKIPYDITYGYQNDSEQNEIQERQNKNNIDFTESLVNLAQAGYEVDPKYIEEITGIPVTKKPEPKPKPNPFNDEQPDEEELTAVENFYKGLKAKYGKHAH